MRHAYSWLLVGLLFATSHAVGAAEGVQLRGDVDKLEPSDKKVLISLLKSIKLFRARVRSMERTPEKQAKVMYALAKDDLEHAKDMYCPAGDAVLEKFNAKKSKEWNVQAMREELIAQLPRARELGCLNHVKNDEVYAVDIPVTSVPEGKRQAFIDAAKRAVRRGQAERFFLHPAGDPDAFHFEFRR